MIAIGDNTSIHNWDFNLDPFQAEQYPSKIHRGGANILFCDGHVQWFAQKELINVNRNTPEGAQMNRMWNRDNQVH
jgi:prepilin-type processing-associated H-X9-DG protein